MDITDYYGKKELDDKQKLLQLMDGLIRAKTIEQQQYDAFKNYISRGMLLKNGKYFDDFLTQNFPDNETVKKVLETHTTKTLLHNLIKERKKIIEFTKERRIVFRKLLNAIYDHDTKMFGMYGYAGTGKTTLVMELVRFLLVNKLVKNVAFTAPTHKALNIMKTNFNNIIKNILKCLKISDSEGFEENLVGLRMNGYVIEFKTIHGLMGYSMNMMGTGEKTFVRGDKSSSDICMYDIIIVDECSMIPLQMIVDLLDSIRIQWKRSQDYCKLPKMIFSGDPGQLPPVNEISSSIFIKDKTMLSKEIFSKSVIIKQNIYSATNALDEAYENFINDVTNMKTVTLTQIFRNKKSNIMDMCFNIRQWVIGEIQIPTMKRYIGNGVTLYKYTGGNSVADKTKTEWFKKCIESFKSDTTSNIILTWTNHATKTYNDALRQILRVNPTQEKISRFEIGDILILNDFYCFQSPSDDTEKTRFYTSEQFKVKNVNTEEVSTDKLDDLDQMVTQKFIKMLVVVRKYKAAMTKINSIISKTYRIWKLDVIRLSNNCEYQDETVFPLNIPHESAEMQVKNESDLVVSVIRRLYKDYQSNHSTLIQQIDKFIMKKLWDYWNHNFVERFANVIYGYSITTHKAQGSTFNNVFVDLDDIFLNSNADEAKRCIYTSITRCANDVHILI